MRQLGHAQTPAFALATCFGMLQRMDVRSIEGTGEAVSDQEGDAARTLREQSAIRFANVICHELRSPLGAIEASSYLLAQRLELLAVDDEVVFRHVDKLRTQVQVCARIIRDLLELARSGDLEHGQSSTKLAAEVEAMVRPSCEKKP